jgi:hypothetical protein
MLVLGTCNPRGEGATYNGLYLRQAELEDVVATRAMVDVPVKTEHSGANVGRVVSAFLDGGGALQCVMEVDEASVVGSLAGGFVRDQVAAELSLGYVVDVQHSEKGGKDGKRLQAGAKKVLEVSLVRKGARDGCHITAYQDPGKAVVYTAAGTTDAAADAWASFSLI